MVSCPDYEPAEFLNGISQAKYAEYNSNSALMNRAIQGTYAPGSIFKMVTAIAGLQEGKITTSERIMIRVFILMETGHIVGYMIHIMLDTED